MILELTAIALTSAGATRATSEVAHYSIAQMEAGRRLLQKSSSVGLGNVLDELFEVALECSEANWDGYGAEPVSDNSYKVAYRFLEALPLGVSAPSIGAEPDGQLTLEWHHSLRKTLSISVSPEHELHYAALIGPNEMFGKEAFFGEVPSRLLDLIRQVSKA